MNDDSNYCRHNEKGDVLLLLPEKERSLNSAPPQ
jgi:hypothetical protein